MFRFARTMANKAFPLIGTLLFGGPSPDSRGKLVTKNSRYFNRTFQIDSR
jgi:hypothetical protein